MLQRHLIFEVCFVLLWWHKYWSQHSKVSTNVVTPLANSVVSPGWKSPGLPPCSHWDVWRWSPYLGPRPEPDFSPRTSLFSWSGGRGRPVWQNILKNICCGTKKCLLREKVLVHLLGRSRGRQHLPVYRHPGQILHGYLSNQSLYWTDQCSPLSLVELQRGSALIGGEVHGVASPAILCHKETARRKQKDPLDLFGL